jgi:hypothetical protein
MNWLGSPALQFALVVFGVAILGVGGYGYYRGRLSRSELAFVLVGAVAWIAYAIEGAVAFLSIPQFVSDFLAAITGFAFVGLFLYWAYSRENDTSD